VVSYRALPVSDLPNVDFPTLNVGAGLPGGDPGTMASAVASPLERQFTTIAGLDEMTSSSSTGSTNVTLQFDMSRDVDSAAVNVPTGQLFGRDATYTIKAGGQLMSAEAFKSIVVSYRNGAPVRLEQVAGVLDNVEDNKNASWLYTKAGARRAINLQVMRQPGS